MSKLAKEIKVLQSRPLERRVDFPALDYTKITEDYTTTPTYSLKYRIGVEFSAQAYINEGSNQEYIGNIVNQVKRGVIEEIFGEFRHPIAMIYIALYDRDYEKARKLLAELENQMFGEGL